MGGPWGISVRLLSALSEGVSSASLRLAPFDSVLVRQTKNLLTDQDVLSYASLQPHHPRLPSRQQRSSCVFHSVWCTRSASWQRQATSSFFSAASPHLYFGSRCVSGRIIIQPQVVLVEAYCFTTQSGNGFIFSMSARALEFFSEYHVTVGERRTYEHSCFVLQQTRVVSPTTRFSALSFSRIKVN